MSMYLKWAGVRLWHTKPPVDSHCDRKITGLCTSTLTDASFSSLPFLLFDCSYTHITHFYRVYPIFLPLPFLNSHRVHTEMLGECGFRSIYTKGTCVASQETHFLNESISHQLSIANTPSPMDGTSKSVPYPCEDFGWFDLTQVLCI